MKKDLAVRPRPKAEQILEQETSAVHEEVVAEVTAEVPAVGQPQQPERLVAAEVAVDAVGSANHLPRTLVFDRQRVIEKVVPSTVCPRPPRAARAWRFQRWSLSGRQGKPDMVG